MKSSKPILMGEMKGNQKGRVLVWISCGAASAVAGKLAVSKYGETDQVELLYCDTLAHEHPDNPRFMADVAKWIQARRLQSLS